MSVETLEQIDKVQEQTAMARKRLEETLEEYILAREASLDALRSHNNS